MAGVDGKQCSTVKRQFRQSLRKDFLDLKEVQDRRGIN